MMNVDALKTLYVKLGGSLTDTYSDIAGGVPVAEYDLISDCILACSKKASSGGGGGSDLPTPGNIGNVLTSTGDGWESAAPTDNEYIVRGTINTDTFAVTVDATYAQIAAAVAANKNVFLVAKDTEETVAMFGRLEMFLANMSATFYAVLYMPGGYKTFVVIVNANDAVDTGTIDTLPIVSVTNNGQILGVSSGSPAWVSPSALSNAPYIVHITQSGTTFSTTETVAEIAAAFAAGKAIQGRYHLEVSEGESLVADVNAAVESFTNVNNGYVLTVSWHDDSEATKRLYLDMTASNTTDVFTYTPSNP